jgi:hypothetical protein
MRKVYAPYLLTHVLLGAVLLWQRAPLGVIYGSVIGLFAVGIGVRTWLERSWRFGRLRLAAGDPHGALKAYERFEQEYARNRLLWRICEVLTAQHYYLDAGGLVNQGVALNQIDDDEEAVVKFKLAHSRAPHRRRGRQPGRDGGPARRGRRGLPLARGGGQARSRRDEQLPAPGSPAPPLALPRRREDPPGRLTASLRKRQRQQSAVGRAHDLCIRQAE